MKYIDNYIIAILIGLDVGNTINYNNICDLPEYTKVNEDRRLEKNFIGTLKATVFNALPQAKHEELLNKTRYHVDVVEEGSFDVGLSASEMNTPTLDDVLLYIKTSNNDFPIVKSPDSTEIFAGLKQYVEALTSDNIDGNTVKYIKWQSQVKNFLKMLDREQTLKNYTIDNSYIKHLPIILYGYVNNLIVFKDYNLVLKQIPFCYECEDSIEPMTKNVTNSDNESDFIDLYVNADITLLYENLTKPAVAKEKISSRNKENTHGFTTNQWKLVKKVILNYEKYDIDFIAFKEIREIMQRSKRHTTDNNKLVQNHISKINVKFREKFGYPLFDRCPLTDKSYHISDDTRENFDTVIKKLGLEEK